MNFGTECLYSQNRTILCDCTKNKTKLKTNYEISVHPLAFHSGSLARAGNEGYVCHWKVSILTLVSKYVPLLISEEQAVVLLWHAEAIACVIETCCENGISNMILTNGAANTVE